MPAEATTITTTGTLVEAGDTVTITATVVKAHEVGALVSVPNRDSNFSVPYDAITSVTKVPRPFKSGDRATIVDDPGQIVEILHVVDGTAMVRYEDNSLGTEDTSNLTRV